MTVEGDPSVLISANIYGTQMATDFWVRELRNIADVPEEVRKLVDILKF